MAVTQNTYTGNGSTVLYSFTFPYLETTDIKVSVNGTVTTAYTLANATTIQFNSAPANGAAIRIYRQTDDSALAATFYPGSAIRSQDLNENFTQNLYVTQESTNNAATATTTANTALTNSTTAIGTANTALSTANTASSNASAAVATANTASSNASAAVSTANTASSNATTAVNTANAATATANSAASDAATALSTANSATSTANAASTAATNAVNTANAASSAASSAVSTANTASTNASNAVTTANTASSNATTAVNTANSAVATANSAAAAVANAVIYTIVANVAAIPASPSNNTAIEVANSTGIESFTPLAGKPGGFVGNSGLSVRIIYSTSGSTWNWVQYFPNDPEARYLKLAGGTLTGALLADDSTSVASPVIAFDGDTNTGIAHTGADELALVTGGTARLTVDPSGNVAVSGGLTKGGNNVVTTGDTGTVTSTMIVDGTIVNADVSASAAIAGTKISPDFGSQTVTTTGVISAAAGAEGTPSIAFTGDLNTGIYSPGADQVAISTNGTGRLFVDANGSIIVNTSTSRANITGSSRPSFQIEGTSYAGALASICRVSDSPAAAATLAIAKTRGSSVGSNSAVQSGDTLGRLSFEGSDGTAFYGSASITAVAAETFTSTSAAGHLLFNTTPTGAGSSTERLRITSAGLVGVGTSSPQAKTHISATTSDTTAASYNQGQLVVSDSDAENSGLVLGYRYNAGVVEYGRIQSVSGSTATNLILQGAGGNVGIGTTSPVAKHHVSMGSDSAIIGYFQGTSAAVRIGSSASPVYGTVQGVDATNGTTSYQPLFLTGSSVLLGASGNEHARIDSSGRLLVGTSSARDVAGNFGGTTNQILFETVDVASFSAVGNKNDSSGPIIALGKSRSGSVGGVTAVQAEDILGAIKFAGANGTDLSNIGAEISAVVDGTPFSSGDTTDLPGRLVFSTTADGASSPTERMRISNNGTTSIGYTANTDYRLGVRGGSAENVVIGSDSTRAQGSGWYNFYGTSDSAAVLQSFIRGDGAYGSRTSTYGGLSDAKLKENIVDAQSQWGDIKSVRFRNFNLIGDSTRQLGVIAQEIEQISPGLVDEINDRDEQGNETGTSTKLVKYSILYMKAVKALQEAMERIETLEAKVAALESA